MIQFSLELSHLYSRAKSRLAVIGVCIILASVSIPYLYYQSRTPAIVLIAVTPLPFSSDESFPENRYHIESQVSAADNGSAAVTARFGKTENNTPKVQHIGFLKVHKAASSTLQNILYRFGLKRKLSFVLPEVAHYISKSKYTVNTVLPPLSYYVTPSSQKVKNTLGKFDILCNHAIFNHDLFRKLLHDDAIYIAIVREPLSLFLSSAYYYRLVWPNDYLAVMNESDFIINLIRKPEVHEPLNITISKTFNTMSQDFGYLFTSVAEAANITNEEFNGFIFDTARVFNFVLIVEMFDESLIMLKRQLSWSFSDIIYVKSNSLASTANAFEFTMPTLSADDIALFHHRNRFDYMLYNYFLKRFNESVNRENRLNEETAAFRQVVRQVQEFCSSRDISREITIPASEWNEAFRVARGDCDLMLMDEIPLWQLMKTKHMEMFNNDSQVYSENVV